MKTFPLIQDPGHAWARVPRKVLISSGCAGSISNHSMERGNNVYLEQDSDLQHARLAIGRRPDEQARHQCGNKQ